MFHRHTHTSHPPKEIFFGDTQKDGGYWCNRICAVWSLLSICKEEAERAEKPISTTVTACSCWHVSYSLWTAIFYDRQRSQICCKNDNLIVEYARKLIQSKGMQKKAHIKDKMRVS